MSVSHWWAGARPHTWPNAFAPVIAGTGAAHLAGGASWWRALLAATVAWALIVGVNYANDYSDGIRGTDDERSGPQRLVGSGLASPQQVKRAAFAAFTVAAVAGIALSWVSAPWLIAVGALCIVAAWFYTGGKKPYGYRGLGEVAVFIFFGLVAVLGTEYTQVGHLSLPGLVMAVGVGSMSAAVNLVNNLRDIPTDSASGKITLAVRLGDTTTRKLYQVLVLMPFLGSVVLAIIATPLCLLGLIAYPAAILKAAAPVRNGATGPELIPVLGNTGKAMVLWTVITTATFLLV